MSFRAKTRGPEREKQDIFTDLLLNYAQDRKTAAFS